MLSLLESSGKVYIHAHERPKKWVILADKFTLTEEQLSKKYLLPLPVASKPYVCSIQYKVLNCNLLLKIIIISSIVMVHYFFNDTVETIQHFCIVAIFCKPFGMMFLQVLMKVFFCF